jgi:hypothetical protein
MLELTSEYNRDMAKANQEVALAMTSNNATGNIGALNEFNARAQIRRQHIIGVARRAVELICAVCVSFGGRRSQDIPIDNQIH